MITQAEWKRYERACERGEVPSGNYCRRCEQYGCGHYLDDQGYVISKATHMRLNRTDTKRSRRKVSK